METKMIINRKWHSILLFSSILGLFTIGSCKKATFIPADHEMSGIEKKLGDDDMINFEKGSDFIRPVLNEFNNKLGVMELTFDGKEIKIYFLPNKGWMLKRGYAHMDKYSDFPFLFGKKQPDINRFKYKYEMLVSEIGVDKSIEPVVETIREPDIPYGRPEPIMVVHVKDIPKSGILAIHTQCRKIGAMQIYKSEGKGWMDGNRFVMREQPMFVEYAIRI